MQRQMCQTLEREQTTEVRSGLKNEGTCPGRGITALDDFQREQGSKLDDGLTETLREDDLGGYFKPEAGQFPFCGASDEGVRGSEYSPCA